jgi:hypothetical protein
MVNLPGRNDRRRRVLKEEILSASSSQAVSRPVVASGSAGGWLRYSDAAGVENHPQITDFVPRRHSTIALLVFMGLASTATLGALHYFAGAITMLAGVRQTNAFTMEAPGSMAGWVSAVVLLVACVMTLLIYSIRRHRIDDFRGRYRVWLGVAVSCLMLSASCVVGLNQMMADALSHFTGWSAMRAGAVWWLTIGGLPLLWIAIRALIDVRECRVAAVLLIAALVCYGVSGAGYFGFFPATELRVQTLAVGASLMLGHWLLLASSVAYARFVVLDAQGLITQRRRSATAKAKTAAPLKRQVDERKQSMATASATGSSVAASRPTLQVAKTPAEPSRWVDGSRPERDHRYEDEDEDEASDDDRKLSKSERKRLRKLKAQNRAA